MTNDIWDDERITTYVLDGFEDEASKLAFEDELRQRPELAAAVEECRQITDQVVDHFESDLSHTLSEDRLAMIAAEQSQPASSGSASSGSTESDFADSSASKRRFWIPAAILATAATIGGLIFVPAGPNRLATMEKSTRVDSAPEPARSAPAFGAESTSPAKTGKIVKKDSSRQSTALSADKQPKTSFAPPQTKTLRSETLKSEAANSEVLKKKMVVKDSTADSMSVLADSEGSGNSQPKAQRIVPPPSTPMQSGDNANHPFEPPSSPVRGRNEMSSADRLNRTPSPSKPRNKTANQAQSNVIESDDMMMGGMGDMMGGEKESMDMGGMMEADVTDNFGTDMGGMGGGGMGGMGVGGGGGIVPPTRRGGSGPVSRRSRMMITPRIIIQEEDPLLPPRNDRFDEINENEFTTVAEEPLSTFSIDVDTASYAKTREYLRGGRFPSPGMVRIEEMLNAFDYQYEAPADDADHPFSADIEISKCPWKEGHQLARIGIQGKRMESHQRPPCNLVFLVDTSGSMNQRNKLPLVIEGLKLLTNQLNKDDRVSIVVYAGSAGMVLESTPVTKKKRKTIIRSLDVLQAGGSTNGGQGISLAYDTARDHFIEGGVNRVILCTDGDFNVGTTSTDQLVSMVEKEAKTGVFLTVLGFGSGNLNDAMMEKISGRGNGNYGFIDSRQEAKRWFVQKITGTLVTIAKDVKLQIEFNPTVIREYRLIGYENRMLAKQDFNDDKKDAGEIGAGHQVTAIYQLVPVGTPSTDDGPKVDPLKYQPQKEDKEEVEKEAQKQPERQKKIDQDPGTNPFSDEMMTVKFRYKQPDQSVSTKFEVPVKNKVVEFSDASENTRLAAAIAGFGMQLRNSKYLVEWDWSDIRKLTSNLADTADEEKIRKQRNELADLVQRAAKIGRQ